MPHAGCVPTGPLEREKDLVGANAAPVAPEETLEEQQVGAHLQPNPVEGATVQGWWNGEPPLASCVSETETDINGQCQLSPLSSDFQTR